MQEHQLAFLEPSSCCTWLRNTGFWATRRFICCWTGSQVEDAAGFLPLEQSLEDIEQSEALLLKVTSRGCPLWYMPRFWFLQSRASNIRAAETNSSRVLNTGASDVAKEGRTFTEEYLGISLAARRLMGEVVKKPMSGHQLPQNRNCWGLATVEREGDLPIQTYSPSYWSGSTIINKTEEESFKQLDSLQVCYWTYLVRGTPDWVGCHHSGLTGMWWLWWVKRALS